MQLKNDLFVPQKHINIKQYFLFIRYWFWLILIVAFLCGGLAYLLSRSMKPTYQATTTVVAGGVPLTGMTNYDSVMTGERLSRTYANLLSNEEITKSAITRIGAGKSTSDLEKSISITPIQNTQLVEIMVEYSDPVIAAKLANSIVEVFNEEVQSNYLSGKQAELKSLQTQINQMEQQINETQNAIQQKSEDLNNQRLKEVSDTITQLKQEIDQLEKDAAHLQYDLPVGKALNQDGRLVTITTTPGVNERLSLSKTLFRLEQQKNLLIKYQDLYFTLSTNSSSQPVDSAEIQQLQSRLNKYQQIYASLLQNYEAAQSTSYQNLPGIVQVDKAFAPKKSTKPSNALFAAFGFLMGLLLSTATIYMFEMFDDHIKDPEIIPQLYQYPVLAANFMHFGRKRKLVDLIRPETQMFETCRMLRIKITNSEPSGSCLLITGPTPSDGGDLLAVSLAAVFAENKLRTILIDTDMYRSNIASLLDIQNQQGFGELLLNPMLLDDIINETKYFGLQVILAGQIPPVELDAANAKSFKNMLQKLKASYDYILISAPPVLSTSETLVLSPMADHVILAVKPEKSTLSVLDQCIQNLAGVNARIMGIVLNLMTSRWYQYFYKSPAFEKAYRKGYLLHQQKQEMLLPPFQANYKREKTITPLKTNTR